ncbi:hypothetical protein Leryth_026226 [Lithospermum erythrorhizon]|nr:hypothetical protein Leryth_026226 [Lithospermum erythrorhizon]
MRETEGLNCGGEKKKAVDCGVREAKKKKVRKSGAAPKDQENRESIVAENDLNLEQVPEKGLSTNSGCPDVRKALEVTEATEDGKAIYENKKKQKAEKAVAGFLDTGDMNRDADQINDKVSVDSPKQDDLMPPSRDSGIHANVQVQKDNDLLPVSKRIEASAGISSDTSRGKNTPPIDSALNQVSVELENEKDGEAAECIGKEINFKQYFVPSHPQDEVTTEQSAGSVTKKKRKEVVPSTVSSPKLLPESTKKDGIISSPGKANNLAESNKLTKTKKKIGKRGVPYATTSSDLDEFRTPSKPVSSAFLNGSDATKTVPRKKEIVNL